MAVVRIENRSAIPTAWIKRVVSEARLPHGRVLLVIGEPRPTRNNNFGETVPRECLSLAGSTVLKVSRYRDRDWKVGVAVYDTATQYWCSHPAFVAYLIGHELGHVKAALSSLALHVQYCLIEHAIFEASGGTIRKCHELPHETWFDEFGMTIARRTEGAAAAEQQIRDLVDKRHGDRDRMERLPNLPDRTSIDDLAPALTGFCRRYHDELAAIWQREKERAAAYGFESLTRLVDDPLVFLGAR